jgi:hypothetical protein
MRIYKELETLGFFKWYCTKHGGINYNQYIDIYDQLQLDNLIRTILNACIFRFFREKYGLIGFISFNEKSTFRIETLPHSNIKLNSYKEKYFDNNGKLFNTYEEAELECIKELIAIAKKI